MQYTLGIKHQVAVVAEWDYEQQIQVAVLNILVILQFATVSMNILTWHFSPLKSTTCYYTVQQYNCNCNV